MNDFWDHSYKHFNIKINLELWSWIEILSTISCKGRKLWTKSFNVFQTLSTPWRSLVDLYAKKIRLRKSFLYYLIILMPKLRCLSPCTCPPNILLNESVGQVFELHHFCTSWEQSNFEEGEKLALKTSRIVVRVNMFLTQF